MWYTLVWFPELSISFFALFLDLYFWYELHSAGDSCAQCTLTADYYNRSVSGWEPLVEPWKYVLVVILKYSSLLVYHLHFMGIVLDVKFIGKSKEL